jgi:hypothetical protein
MKRSIEALLESVAVQLADPQRKAAYVPVHRRRWLSQHHSLSAKRCKLTMSGRLVNERHVLGEGAGLITWDTSASYWPDGSLRRKTLADGTSVGDYLYDSGGQLKSIGNPNPTSCIRGTLPFV